jgi:hypothetical protein
MPEELPRRAGANSFKHEPVLREPHPHLLVKSMCKRCGASGVVSVYDGSLEKWEDGHECKKRPQTATLAFVSRLRSWLSL